MDRLAARAPSGVAGSARFASVTASSVARTDRPSATMRAASSSCCSGPPSSASSARACPADSTPAATRRCTAIGSRSSRIMLVMSGRGPADARGQFVVGDAELVEQLLVGRRLFERVELGAVDVLQQGVAQHAVVGGLADDRGDGRQPGLLRGPPPPLPHDELVPSARTRRASRAPRSAA